MLRIIKGIVLTLIGLLLLAFVADHFGTTAALIGAGVCFVGYIAFISAKETAAEMEDENEEDGTGNA